LPGERNNARNNARCTQARNTMDLQAPFRTFVWMDNTDTWTELTMEESIRMAESGENTFTAWPTLGSKNRTEPL